MPLPHVNRYRDRHGKLRIYYRPPGQKNVALPDDPDSEEFRRAYEAAASERKPPIGEDRNPSGSVAQAVSLYLASGAFARLAPDTQRTRKNELERFREAKGEKPMGLMEPRHIERHIAKKSPGSARNCLKALTPWLKWCVREDLIKANPAAAIERPVPVNKDGYRTWTDDLVERYRAHHPIGTKAGSTFELLINVGAARVDTAQLGRQHVRNGMLCYRRHKTGVLIEIPILAELQQIIDQMAVTDRLSFIATEQGMPYTKESFGNYFRRWCDEAGIPKGYSAHGLRKYAAVLRANLGATVNELMSWFGWLSEREATRYTRDADRRRLAMRLGEKVNAAFPNPRPG